MTENSTVSVIVINYNTPQLTAELLSSLRAHSESSLREILVVDNDSQADSRFRPDSPDPRLRVWHLNRNLGFGKANNFAAEFASGDYLLLANSDCRVTSDILSQMVEFLDSHPEAGACAPRLMHPNGESHASARELPTFENIGASRRSLWRRGKTYTLPAVDKRITVPAVSATFLLIRRELFLELQGFDAEYFMYVEDTDLCRRIGEAGKSIWYLGDLTVVHHWGASSRKSLWRLAQEHHRSIRHYFSKFNPQARAKNLYFTCKLVVNLFATLVATVVVRLKR